MSSSPDWRVPGSQPRWRWPACLAIVLALILASPALLVQAGQDRLDPALRAARGAIDVLVQLRPVAVLAPPQRQSGEPVAVFRQRLVDHWQAQARASQAGLQARLDAQGIEWRSFWLVNALALRLDAAVLPELAARGDVLRIHDDAPRQRLAVVAAGSTVNTRSPAAIEWGVGMIGAPDVWAAGITGQGVVVGGQDTGVRWSHQALRQQYRGWDGVDADHGYSWHDAIGELLGGGTNPCGVNAAAPCDDHNHGSHTIGTIVGDDGGSNRIGVAPDARWIACRNMERGIGRASTYAECFQWFVAPGGNGRPLRPDLAPDVINNSWSCPPDELCQDPGILRDIVASVRQAGIVVVASAGNDGPACGSLAKPPAIYAEAFTVGATSASGALASFSARGPVAAGSLVAKPDVVAPGVAVRSALRGSDAAYGNMSGTSMAGPHVAGAVALLIAANPGLRGEVDRIEDILRQTSLPFALSGSCGGQMPGTWPNFQAGHGRIDAWAAFRVAETIFADGFQP